MQGFATKLEQYELDSKVEQGQNNDIYLGKVRLTGDRVAVKAIPIEKYKLLKQRNGISES